LKIPEGWKPVPVKETHEMRTAFREAEKGALLSGHDHIEAFFCGYRAMLAAAPTPPAQEDEPVAYMDAHDNWDLYKNKPEQVDVIPLYTRPDNSKLRKAAEEVIEQLKIVCRIDFCGLENRKAYYKAFVELRAALEDK
jgi:hypothetical protein